MIKIILFVLMLFCFVVPVYCAEASDSSVKLEASVVEKKPTDTINDFNLAGLNPDQYKNLVKDDGLVSGVSKKAPTDNSLKILLFELIAVTLATIIVILTRRKHRLFTKTHDITLRSQIS